VQEPLVAYAEDCVVRGRVELGDGRLSDAVNELDLITFHEASLEALDDGRIVRMGELEIERRDLHVIEVRGRRGDPSRRLRTVEERVILEIGPYVVTGNLHRPPHTQPLAALSRWTRFLPVTDAVLQVSPDAPGRREEVLLVNRDRIAKSEPLDILAAPGEPVGGGEPAPDPGPDV
jgi:hypothetical protein